MLQYLVKLKNWSNIFHVIVNANLIVQRVTQIKNEMMINANMSVTSIIYAKRL